MRNYSNTRMTILSIASLLLALIGGLIIGCHSDETSSLSGPTLSANEAINARTEYNKKNPAQYTEGTSPGIAMTMDFTTYHIDGQPYGDWRLRASWVGSQGGNAEVTTDVAVSIDGNGQGSALIPAEFLNDVVQLIQQKYEEGKDELGIWWYDQALILELYRNPNGDEKTYEYYNVNLGQPGYTYELSATSVAGGLQQILKVLGLSWWPGKAGSLPQDLALALNIGQCIGVREIPPSTSTSSAAQDYLVADAYVWSGTSGGTNHATKNYGTETALALKNDSPNYTRQSYLKFDLNGSGLTGVTGAKLRLYAQYVGAKGADIAVNEVTDDTWTETGITWDTKPANGAQLGSVTVPTAGQYYEWDVTAFVNAQLAGDKVVSLHVENMTAGTGSDYVVDFYSREAGTNTPQLVLTP